MLRFPKKKQRGYEYASEFLKKRNHDGNNK